jgi:hypothetical protein
MSEMRGYEEGIQEVQRWKESVSLRIEKVGFAEFDRQAAKETQEFVARIEAARQAKLVKAANEGNNPS